MIVLIGIAILAVGILLVVFRGPVYNFTGYIDFVEGWFPGGTHTFLLVSGLAACFIGILMITGVGDWLVQPIADQIFRVSGR